MKPELIAFSENKIGGVQSYYYNLLSNDFRDSFKKRWIFTEVRGDQDAKLHRLYNCCEEIIFNWSSWEESVMRRLSHLISNRPGIIMTNHEMELLTLRRFPKNRKTIVYVCHDELYVANALKYEYLIDVYIVHNPAFGEVLEKELPANRRKDVYFLPYGIKLSTVKRSENKSGKLKLLFIARLAKKKGIFDLALIDDQLKTRGVEVEWTVIGDGPDKEAMLQSLAGYSNFTLQSPETTDEIFEIASRHDLYILPSYLDGMPVALLEAMSVGLVPLVSHFNEGITTVVRPDLGFVVPVGDNASFAEKIEYLDSHRDDLEGMSKKSLAVATNEYNVTKRAKNYYALFLQYKKLRKARDFVRLPGGGLLDYPFIPEFVREGIRDLRKSLRWSN